MHENSRLPATGLIRIERIIGNPKRGIEPLIPIGRTAWYAGIAAGRYPQPVKLGRASAWRVEEIRKLIEGGAA